MIFQPVDDKIEWTVTTIMILIRRNQPRNIHNQATPVWLMQRLVCFLLAFHIVLLYKMLPALEITQVVGYVHRDVCAGNILFWNSTGLLSDLELAKKTSDFSTHEARTVPVEVREQGYLFMEDEDDKGDNNKKDNKDDKYCGSPPLFKFNCLHDLESAWWIALWILFHHVPLRDDGVHTAQTEHAAEQFPSVRTSSSRCVILWRYQMPYTASSAGFLALCHAFD